ncbi:MAG: hypothetical protein IBJ03_18385 [Gemmatimonadaceae bacterium]|nr:hypothetical protein [Gemmatimonadaceae bacterium]
MTVQIRPPSSAYWLIWIIVGLIMLPFVLVLVVVIFRPEVLRTEPAVLPSFGAVALLAFTAGRRVLRPITVQLNDDDGVVQFSMPRLLRRPKRVTRALQSLVSVDLVQSGEIRHRLYGYRYPTWSLYACFDDGSTLPLRRDIVAMEAPWTEASATINAWCVNRRATPQASVAV